MAAQIDFIVYPYKKVSKYPKGVKKPSITAEANENYKIATKAVTIKVK